MINKIINFLLIFLFTSIPLINSSLFDLFWIHLWLNVSWNYEFTKVIFFNIISTIIILLFSIDIFINKKNKIFIPKLIFLIFFSFTISAYFSISPYISFIWNTIKAHSFIMYINLIGLYIIVVNLPKKEIKKILKYSIIWLILSSIISIWQLYYPSFNYWNLSNRALWTFWHPDYLSLYLLIFIPLLYKNIFNINKDINYIIIILTIITILLTKSLTAIIILTIYTLYFISNSINKKYKNTILYWTIIFFILTITIIFYNFGFSKIHSFLSRFFIWTTVINISFENIKSILIWHWFETLNLIFDKNKSPFLYIFENIWFTADRAHNIILQFLYNSWLLGLSLISYWFYYLLKNNHSIYKISIILALIFLMFNFSSITSLIFIILLLWKITKNWINHKYNNYIIYLLLIISIIGMILSYKLYKSENLIKFWKIHNIEKIFKYNPNNYFKNWKYKEWLKYSKIKTQLYYKSYIYFSWNINKWCKELIKNIPSVENMFFCWNLYWKKQNKNIAKKYYILWLSKLPDLWNKNSKYYNNFIIKESINWARFFSPKYSNLKQILKRMWIKIEYK